MSIQLWGKGDLNLSEDTKKRAKENLIGIYYADYLNASEKGTILKRVERENEAHDEGEIRKLQKAWEKALGAELRRELTSFEPTGETALRREQVKAAKEYMEFEGAAFALPAPVIPYKEQFATAVQGSEEARRVASE